MSERTGSQQQDKPRSGVKPGLKPEKRKQLVSIRRGTADTESAEEHAAGSGLFEQRPAVRRLPADTGSPPPERLQAPAESRFAHDFSRVRTHTAAPEGHRDVGAGTNRVLRDVRRPRNLLAARDQVSSAGPDVSRQPAAGAQQRQDAVIIVGRPSQTTRRRETAKQRDDMNAWRAAAKALSPNVFEGLRVDIALAKLSRSGLTIGKLYIIAHFDPAGIGEVRADGATVSTSVTNLVERIKKAAKNLGNRAPRAVDMLSCYGGGIPTTMGKIGKALGASAVRAPVEETVITSDTIIVEKRTLTRRQLRRLRDSVLEGYIQQIEAHKKYDFVPGVPHPQTAPSKAEKLKALVGVVRKLGRIPYVAYNAAAGEHDAVPYWKGGPGQGVREVKVKP
jgi:hypothetical protein